MISLRHWFLSSACFLLLLFVPARDACAWKMEAGKLDLSVTSSLTQLESHNFQQIYDTAPIVIALATTRGGDASAVRISNVTTTGFRMSPVEPRSEDGPHASMTVSYLAIEPGTHTLPNGETIEAGTVMTNETQYNGIPSGQKGWETLVFGSTFNAPVLLASIQTIANETDTIPRRPSHPWLTVAVDNISNTQADIALERSEVFDSTSGPNFRFNSLGNTESIGYVVMDRGVIGNFLASGNLTVNFESLYSANSVDGWSDGCDNINFAGSYSTAPVVLATKSTHDEDDGGWLRECSTNSSRVQLTIDEDDNQDRERNHTLEDASLLLFSSPFYYDSNAPTSLGTASTLMLESKSIDLDPSSFTTVVFDQVYELPPAVFLLEDDQNPEPSSVRIRNVTNQSFELVPVEPDSGYPDAADQTTTVQYLAISKGQFQFPDGKGIEVGPIVPPDSIINFQSKRFSGDSWFNLNFATSFSATPALLSQIQSMNSETGHTPGSPSRPWLTTAVRNVTSSGGQLALDRAETNTGTISAAEQFAFLAIEPGIIGDFQGVAGNTISSEAQRTADNIAGTRSCQSIGFLQGYADPPLVIGSQMTWDGGDGGWLRRCSTGASQVNLKIEEDWALDRDNSHTTERAGFMAFSEPFYADFSLVANYQLEGPVWSGVAGEVIDSSGSNLNGQRMGDARPFPAQVCNGAVLDGDRDYIEIPDDPILDISDELTVMAWIKPESLPGSDLMTIISKDTNFEFHLDTAGRVLWWWNNSASASRSFTSDAARVTVGNWHHVAIVYSRSAGSQTIYFDGMAAASRSYANEALINNNLPMLIGTDYAYPSRDFNGSIDEVKVFKRALPLNAIQKYAAETRPCASCVLGSFDIAQPTYALACPDTRAQVDITARCVDGTVKTDYLGTVALSAPSGAAFFDAATGGNAITSLSYGASEAGENTAYLYFDNENNAVQVTANDTAASVSSTALTGTDFRAFGFNITSAPGNFACGDTTSMTMVAYGRTDNAPSGTCAVLTGFEGDKTMDTWFRATLDDDTVADSVTRSLTVAGTAITAQDNTANDNLTLNFTNGASSFDIAYPDAARILDLNFRFDAPPYDGSEFSAMATSTTSFVVRPNTFSVTARSGVTDINGNSSGDTTTHKAGEAFDLSLTAQCTDGSTALDYQPNNSTTAVMAYLQRTGPLGGSSVDGTMPIAASKILTSNPSSTITWESAALAAGNFSNGVYSYAGASFSEVGLTRLHVKDQSYFGEEVTQSSVDIGRFIPDHFEVLVNSGSLAPFCSPVSDPDFSYSGQPINYATLPSLTIQARNTNNSVTSNYTEAAFLKLEPSDVARVFPVQDSNKVGADLLTNVDLVASAIVPTAFTSAAGGVITYTFDSTDNFTYTRNANALVDTFDTDITVVVSDIIDDDLVAANVASYDVTPTAIELRYGRAVLENAYGPELFDLEIPMRIEFWDGSAFDINSSDSCTTFASSDLIDTENLSGGSTTPAGGGTLSAGVPADGDELLLSAPGVGNIGRVDLEFQVDSWLRFDWDSDGSTADTNPTSSAIFGQYRGHDRVIYWREIRN